LSNHPIGFAGAAAESLAGDPARAPSQLTNDAADNRQVGKKAPSMTPHGFGAKFGAIIQDTIGSRIDAELSQA
jgi:hypothetical protein